MDQRALIVMAIVGVVSGYLASYLVGPSSWGLIGYLVSGLLGSCLGGFVLEASGINLGIKNALLARIATATIGAVIVVSVARIVA